MQLLTIGKNQAGQRLDKFLKKALPNAGTGFLYKMLRKKNITLNGKKAEGKEILAQGDEVKCFFSEETYASMSGAGAAEDTSDYRKAYRSLKDISVLYEDENILLLNKPAGVLTQKAKPEDLSLNEWLIGHLLAANAIKETDLATFHPSVCNRLDRNTSGIVLCGKTLAGSQALSRIIKDRSVKKYYQTVCRQSGKGRSLTDKMFVGLENYVNGLTKTGFFQAFGWTLFITVFSVAVILLCTSMCAWYINRVTNTLTKTMYMLCLFSMVVPFQMVMFTLSKIANILKLNTPWGLSDRWYTGCI